MKFRCKLVCYFMIVLCAVLLTLSSDLAGLWNGPAGQPGNVVMAIPPSIIMYDFGTSYSPVEPGYNQVTRYTAYTSGSYGWTNTYRMEDGDRGTPADNLKRDFCYSTQTRTFRTDIPNGVWLLEYTIGDASYAHDNMKIVANGVTVNGINSGLNQFVTGEIRVVVSTGNLQVEFSDNGGIDPCWVIDSIVLRPNIAPQATVTASSTYPGYSPYGATDGIISGYPYNYNEWASNKEKDNAWLKLTWSTPKTIRKVRFYDRINLNDQVWAYSFFWNSFADGTAIELPNDGMTPGKIDAGVLKQSTWLEFRVDQASFSTYAVGLAEIEVYE